MCIVPGIQRLQMMRTTMDMLEDAELTEDLLSIGRMRKQVKRVIHIHTLVHNICLLSIYLVIYAI